MKRWIAFLFCALLAGLPVQAGDFGSSDVTYGDSSTSAGIKIQRARGQFTSPEHLYSEDILNGLFGYGYGATGFQSNYGVSIELKAVESWTDSSQGTRIGFKTTPSGSTSATEVVTISSDGFVGIGTTKPSAALEVAGKRIAQPTGPIGQMCASSTTINPSAEFVVIWATGALTLDSQPNISTSTAKNGQFLFLISTNATISLQDKDAKSNSFVKVSSAGLKSIDITTYTPTGFVFYNSAWNELRNR